MNTSNVSAESRRRRVQIIGKVLIFIILAAVIELASHAALRFFLVPTIPSAFYTTPPNFDQTIFDRYMQYRHPVVGWATEVPSENRYAVDIESRPNKIFPNAKASCVSLYGDSFTFGSEVNDDEAWGNVLSGLLDCKVANYAQGGYGTDQAYLRFELTGEVDKSPVNILTIYPDNILRNLNQYRPYLAGPHANWLGVKPRFIIENEELRLIPEPSYTYDELIEASDKPETLFNHEVFLPNTANGLPRLKFPFSLTVARFIVSKKIRNYITNTPSWIHFLEEDHPSDGLKIVNAIVQKFADLSVSRGQTPLLVIYPTSSSYRYYKKTGIIATQPISESALKKGIRHLDLHEPFAQYLGERSYCEVLTMPDSCVGHYNHTGNIAVAGFIRDVLEPMLSK